MTRVTIIGGSGFIGTHLCQRLADSGIAFEIVDLRPSPRFPARTRIADIRDRAAIAAAVTGDVVVHLAAVHADNAAPEAYYATNVEGTRNVVAACDADGIARIVFASSVAVYGFPTPGSEEACRIAPFNDYGRSKWQAEQALHAWQAESPERRSLLIVRPTVVFGEGNRGNVFALFDRITAGRFVMIGNGTNRKSMAYVGNVAAFLEACIDAPQTIATINYVDQPDLDMNTLVALVRREVLGKEGVGLRVPFWTGLAAGRAFDALGRMTGRGFPISAIRVRKFAATTRFPSGSAEIEGFAPPYSLAEGLERTLRSEFISPDPSREVFPTG